MNYLFFWILGFSTFWVGLKLFDDEAVLIVTTILGSAFVLIGLTSAPPALQIPIEITSVFVLFNVCMQCIKRGQ